MKSEKILNESFKRINNYKTKKIIKESLGEMVGYHCSPNEIEDDAFIGNIEDNYVDSTGGVNYLPQILEIIMSGQYKDQFLNLVDEYNQFAEEEDDPDYFPSIDLNNLPEQYDEHFDHINRELINYINTFYNWVFVHRSSPHDNYGSNCYEVYFTNMNEVNHIDDRVDYGADIYIYPVMNPPKLKKIR